MRTPMKAIALAIGISLTVSTAVASAGEMDLVLRNMLRNTSTTAFSPGEKALPRIGGDRDIPCLIRSTDPETTSKAIAETGGETFPVAGGILSARIPLNDAASIIARPEIIVAEGDLRLSSKMDTARAATEVDVVQDGTALGIPYDGTNVVVGIADDALDYGHPDFTGLFHTSRIQYLRQTASSETLECTKRTVMNGGCRIENGGQGMVHGTHVTGIAAGADGTYTGVAPASDIMFAFLSPADADSGGAFATDVLEGVTAIFSKADLIDKAAVVNLSIGTSIGAHDGTSLLEQGLSALSAARPGRIIINAAGNEQTYTGRFDASTQGYVGGLHASIDAAVGASQGFRLAVWRGASAASAFTGGTLVDLWLDAGQKDACTVAAFAYTGGRSARDFSFPNATAIADAALATGDVPFAADTAAPVEATGAGVKAQIDVASSDPRNGKPHATILFSPSSGSGSALETVWFDVVLRSNGTGPCSGHLWLYYDAIAYHDFLTNVAGTVIAAGGAHAAYTLADGDGLLTTTIPATAEGVIAAGSFMPPKPVGATSSTWTGDNGTTYDQSSLTAPGGTGSTTNDLSVFSSLGPTADGRRKPDIVAPGEPIIAAKARDVAVSSALTVGGDHFKEAGTSMASPHVTGIVALLLQRNNTLTVDGVRAALAAGATASGMTSHTADPADSYGAGKVDAAAVLASVAPDTSAYHGTGDLESPDGGCALLPPGSTSPASSMAPFLLAAITLIALRARNRC